jgi:hypothetical protein
MWWVELGSEIMTTAVPKLERLSAGALLRASRSRLGEWTSFGNDDTRSGIRVMGSRKEIQPFFRFI